MNTLLRKMAFATVAALLTGCAATAGTDEPLTETFDNSASDSSHDSSEPDIPATPQPDATLGCLTDEACTRSDTPTCRVDVCVDGACIEQVVEDFAPCDDGNPCTSETYCEAGGCGGGRASICTDDNPCTVDACDPITGCSHDPTEDGGSCDDDDPCSLGDACLQGVCVGTSDPACSCETDADCTPHEDGNLCNGSLSCQDGTCHLAPETVVICPPAGACEFTACQASTGECLAQSAPNGTGCDDGNPCTVDDRCSEGGCVGTPGTCPCEIDADCAVLQTESYDLCQGPLHCDDTGLCVPDTTQAVVCENDENPDDCTETLCNPGTGLCATVHQQDGTPCEDDDPCTPEGYCSLGTCVTGDLTCFDDNPCTEDLCLGEDGCAHAPLTGPPCSDGDACTVGDLCVTGNCQGGEAVVCDDQEPCTIDKCESAAGGCTTEAVDDGTSCETLDLCMGPGSCNAGICSGGESLSCPPAGPCLSVGCDPALGCVETALPDGTTCEDGNTCTQTGSCDNGACATVPIACNDDNPCTIDSCSDDGCVHTSVDDTTPCDTGDPCQESGSCLDGLCQGAVQVTCPPGPCDVKTCDPDTGACIVSHLSPDGTSCGADDACDIPGSCSEGSCLGASQLSCDDEDACTVDTCEPEFGLCKHVALQCAPSSDSPCDLAGCDSTQGCTLDIDTECTSESLLWHSVMGCGGEDGWDWGVSMGHPLFGLSELPPNAGNLNPGCHAQIVVPSQDVALEAPWTSSMTSPGIEVTIVDNDAPLVVRFWHTWEWEGADANDDVERRVQLIGDEDQIVESIPLESGGAAWGIWTQSEVTLPFETPGTYRIAFTLTSKPTADAPGYTWTIDHVVLYLGPPPT